ncbi:hypothetical protein AB205_0081740 [Aquarana catesbeiana]|uniref:Uncharacterized protein n=1 Tax=Aquarana catesbeiana TaxID=8400 RepID=A0A2G9Q3V5_AQUCT|nr:hypothetical protein AB205_0081740 [Aquarana catesbeiana]
MGCKVVLENIKKNINEIRTSLMFWGEFKTPPNPFLLWCANIFCRIVEKPNFEEAHSVSTCAICHHGRSMDAFWGATPSSIIK